MRVFFNAIIVQIFLSLYVLLRGCQAVPRKIHYRITLIVFFSIEILLYFIGFFYSKHLSVEVLHNIAWMGTSWMIFIGYTSGLLLFYDALKFLTRRKKLFGRIDLHNKKISSPYFWFSIVLVCLTMMWGNYKFHHPAVKEINIEITDKQTELDSLRIVVAADLHVGFLIRKNMLEKYINLIMEQKPDLILLVGDVIDFDLKSVMQQDMKTEFNKLHAPYGVYISTGNHEYIGLAEEEPFAKVNWLNDSISPILLRDSIAYIDKKFYVVGREDDKYKFRKELDTLMTKVDTRLPVILMNHEPSNIHESAEHNIDLAFYGHTHNGQIFPNNFLLKTLWELSYGYKKIDKSHVYVTSGLGLAGPQFRIGTNSEILVCNIVFKK